MRRCAVGSRILTGDDDANTRLARTERQSRIGFGARPEQVHHQVEDDLVVAAGVEAQLLCPVGLGGVDESRATAARTHRGADDRIGPGSGLLVELHPGRSGAVLVAAEPPAAVLVALVPADRHTGRIELVAQVPCPSPEFIGVDARCSRDEPLCSAAKSLGIESLVRLPETPHDDRDGFGVDDTVAGRSGEGLVPREGGDGWPVPFGQRRRAGGGVGFAHRAPELYLPGRLGACRAGEALYQVDGRPVAGRLRKARVPERAF